MPVPTVVQSSSYQGSGTAVNGAGLQSNQTLGNQNICFVGLIDGTTNVTSVTDQAGNTYVPVPSMNIHDTTNGGGLFAFWCSSIASFGMNNYATAHMSASVAFAEVYLIEVNGGPYLDSINDIAIGSGATASLGPKSTGEPNVLAVAYCYTTTGNFAGQNSTGAGASWTAIININTDVNGVTQNGSIAEYQDEATSGTAVTATTAFVSTSPWLFVMVGLAATPTFAGIAVPFWAA